MHCKKFPLLLSAKSQCEAIKKWNSGTQWDEATTIYYGILYGDGDMPAACLLSRCWCCGPKLLQLQVPLPVPVSVPLSVLVSVFFSSSHFMAQAKQIIYHLYSCAIPKDTLS